MNLGPLSITRRRRGVNNRYQLPWETLIEEDLSPEILRVVAKVARSVCKDYLQEVVDWNWQPAHEPHTQFSIPPNQETTT